MLLAVNAKLKRHREHHLIRRRFALDKIEQYTVAINQQSALNFASSDYLNLRDHPRVKESFIAGAQQYGLGSGSSAMISGYTSAHQQLEEHAAEFLQRDRALLFNSGYQANLGVLSALTSRQTEIFSDRLCHASILDGIQLSRAKHYRYQHTSLADLQRLLLKRQNDALIITESVFSMEGNISPIDQIVQLAKASNTALLVDDAHGFGVLGKSGRGICEQLQLTQADIPCLITPLGKAGASMGAIVSGSEDLIEAILQFSRTYIYTTALPPAIALANIEVLKLIAEESWRRDKLQHLIQFFIMQTKMRDFTLTSTNLTPIKSIIIGDNQRTELLQQQLLARGFFVSCIRPPTVPEGTARIRISLNCLHEESDIVLLLDLLKELYDQSSG